MIMIIMIIIIIILMIIIMVIMIIELQGSVCGSIATAATRPSALPAQTLNTGSMALSGNNHHDDDDDDDDEVDGDDKALFSHF